MTELPRTTRLFVAFRVFFNARFYYPVLAVLFVDLGLTLDQYALLNVAWAVAIVLAELPLGALGDTIGRRPLVVGAAVIMVIEMAVLAFAPTGNVTLLFWLFLVNRALSGVAEAAASGADEALAYDSLVLEGLEDRWPEVLAVKARWQAGASLVAMVIGAAVYDPTLMQRFVGWSGSSVQLDQQTTARFPVYLTLVLAFGALASALGMRECPPTHERSALGAVLAAGRWIARTRFILAIVLLGLVVDAGVRLFLTMNSTYFRMVGIPESLFGLLGAAITVIAFFVPQLARRRVEHSTPLANYTLVVLCAFLGLAGVAFVSRWWGVLFVIPMGMGFFLLDFFASTYLNRATTSDQRATVLSFRSLANNLAYGAAGWGFALLMRLLAGGHRPPSGSMLEEETFARALIAAPALVAALSLPLLAWSTRLEEMRHRGSEAARSRAS